MFSKTAIATLHSEMHRRFDDLLQHAERLTSGAFTAEMPGFGRASIRTQLAHIAATEQFWVNAVQGRHTPKWDYDQFKDVASVRSVKQKIMHDTLDYLNKIDDTALNATLQSRPPQWMGPLRSPAFILCHVVTHAFHHKGQIVAMFRLANCPIGDADLQREELTS